VWVLVSWEEGGEGGREGIRWVSGEGDPLVVVVG